MPYYTVKRINKAKAQKDWFDNLYGTSTTRLGNYDPLYTYHHDTIKPTPYSPQWFNTVQTEAIQFLQQNPDTTQAYNHFMIPKHSGGMRRIDAPVAELKEIQRRVSYYLTHLHNVNGTFVHAHNSAFAYVEKRGTVDALKIHQKNESRWFLKLDVKDFFPSFTKEFIMQQRQHIWPWVTINDTTFSYLIDVCLLNNALPQGSPASPMLSNILFLPLDVAISKALNAFPDKYFKYTRYADDLLISSRYDFDKDIIEALIVDCLKDSPFTIKTEKTRYGSSSGRNWNLGLMFNKDNVITIGHKRKAGIKASLRKLFMDYANETVRQSWTAEDIYHLQGMLSYLRMVEPQYHDDMVARFECKFGAKAKDIFKIFIN